MNLYNNKVNTNFYGNEIPEKNECYARFSVALLDSFIKVGKKVYPQIPLEEFKYAVKKKKIINAINEELNLDESDDESDNDLED